MSEVNGILATAHDLKGPLSALRQMILTLDLCNDPAERAHLESRMVIVVDGALRQVNDLIKIARLADSRLDFEPISARALCDEIHRELAPSFLAEERALRLLCTNRQRLAYANRELLHSVIYNFCTNALRYSERSTASLLTVSDSGQRIRIGVRDFGPSLPIPVWRNLRSGGLTAPTTVAMRPDGAGLGLYVASEFARSMNAKLGAIRHHDGVSLFIDLPISNQLSVFDAA